MIRLFILISLTLIIFNCGDTVDSPIPVSSIPVSSVSVDNSVVGLVVEGASSTVVATVLPTNASNKAVTWRSSDSSIVTVSPSGEIIGVSAGTATITVTTADGGHTNTVAVTVTTINVTSVSVSNDAVNLVVGSLSTVVATVLPADAIDKTVRWSSSDTAIATVDGGVIVAVAVGMADITVTTTDGSITAIVSVTVIATTVNVTSVSVGSDTVGLVVRGTATVMATVSPNDATDKIVAWRSSDLTKVTVSSSGVVTGESEGTATITVMTADGGYTDTVVVIVTTVSVSSVSVDIDTVSIVVGISSIVVATVLPADANDSVIWSSSSNEIAIINESGVITGISEGVVIIIVKTEDRGHTDTVVVIVTISVTSVSVDISTLSLVVGETSLITATVLPNNATNPVVTWTSSDTAIATVYANGVITGESAGTATITVTTADGGYTDTVVVIVTPPISVTSVSVDISTLSLVVGETSLITATILPDDATNKAVTWTSSDTAIATVNANGIITGVWVGTAIITVTTADGDYTDTIVVIVIPTSVTSVNIVSGTVNLGVGARSAITATVLPNNATNPVVTWTSSDTAIATVYANGVITGKSAGTATITVTTADGGYTDTAVVIVSGDIVTSVSVNVDSDTINLVVGDTSPITATILPASAIDKGVRWTSSADTIATVSSLNLPEGTVEITGESAGTATITVRTTDGGYMDSVFVTVAYP